MGNYNKEYEKYYRKINKTSPNNEMSFKTERYYGRKKRERFGQYFVRELVFSSILGFFLFFSFFSMGQGKNEFLIGLCGKFKEVLMTDAYYKKLALSESKIVSAMSNGIKNTFKLDKDSSTDNKELSDNKTSNDIGAFNNFEVIEKEAIDFLKESTVVPFSGKVETLENYKLEGANVYLSGEQGEVKNILDGTISKVQEENGVYNIKVKYDNDLEVLYHNLDSILKKEGDKVKKGEVLGISSKNEKLSGILIQVLFKNEYIKPEESLSFLGDKH